MTHLSVQPGKSNKQKLECFWSVSILFGYGNKSACVSSINEFLTSLHKRIEREDHMRIGSMRLMDVQAYCTCDPN